MGEGLKFVFIIIFKLMMSIHLVAQPMFRFEQLGHKQGLSHNLVNCIAQDKQGYLWIGTEDGLNRYDGYSFKVFKPDVNCNNCPSGHNISGLFVDSHGSLWIYFFGDGLTKYNTKLERFEQVNCKPGIAFPRVTTIQEDSSGNIWVGTRKGLFRIDSNGNCTGFSSGKTGNLADAYVTCVYNDPSNNIWVGTNNGLSLFISDLAGFKSQKLFETSPGRDFVFNENVNKINSILCDSAGNVWIGSDAGGIFMIPDNSDLNQLNKPWQIQQYHNLIFRDRGAISVSSVFKIVRANRKLWFGTSSGLLVMDEDKPSHFRSYLYHKSNLDNYGNATVLNMVAGEHGDLWVSLKGAENQLCVFDLTSESHYRVKSNKFADSEPFGLIYKDKMGVLWVCQNREGIFKANLHTLPFNVIDQSHGLSSKNAYALALANGFLWAGTSDGLNKISLTGEVVKTFKHNPGSSNCPAAKMVSSLVTTNKSLWLGYYDGQLSRLDFGTGKFHHFTFHPMFKGSIVSWAIHDLLEDSKGRLWIASHTALSVLNPGEKDFTPYMTGPSAWPSSPSKHDSIYGIKTDITNSLAETPDGSIWVGTFFAGLARFKPENGRFKHFYHVRENPQSLGSNEIRDLLVDSSGKLWVATAGGGLNLYDEKNERFIRYTTQNGLPDNTIQCILQDGEHYLWLSTNKGICRFHPDKKEVMVFSLDEENAGSLFNKGSGAWNRINNQLYFGGPDGIVTFNPQQLKQNPYKPEIVFQALFISGNQVFPGDTVNGRVVLKAGISHINELKMRYDEDFSLHFTGLHFGGVQKLVYRYFLDGLDQDWRIAEPGVRSVSYNRLPPGNYVLHLQVTTVEGAWTGNETQLTIIISPPVWETWWFRIMISWFFLMGIYIIYRYRVNSLKTEKLQLEQKVSERTAKLLEVNRLLAEQNSFIIDQKEKLHQADTLKIKFFTNISHELRTPLTIILGLLEKYTGKSKIKKSDSDFSIMARNAGRLLRLVNQLLDYKKLEQNDLKPEIRYGNLGLLLAETIENFAPLAKQYELSLTNSTNQEEILCWFNDDIMEKVFHNLISNAIKYTPKGGEIDCRLVMQNKKIRFSIDDTGIGIPLDEQAQVFDRFYQASNKKLANLDGSGIGLALTKELTEVHLGKITVQNNKHGGTKFEVEFPADQEVYSNAGFPIGQLTESMPGCISLVNMQSALKSEKQIRYTVMVVEDNPDLRYYISEILSDEYRVIEAENGLEGLEKIRKNIPDLVVSDIMMPEINGRELCQQIKSYFETSHIPVILLTALGSQEQVVSGFDTGADDYIVKPFDSALLLVRIQNLLTNRERIRRRFKTEPEIDLRYLVNNTTDQKFLDKIVGIIHANIDNTNLDGDFLVKELGTSRSALYRKVDAITGMSVNIFVRTVRLKYAARLLLTGKYSVTEVSYASGFSMTNYFCKCFAEYFKMSPTEYIASQS